MRAFAVTCCLLLACASARADEPTSAAQVTEPGRTMTRALDIVLRGSGEADAKRTLVILVDPTPSLRAAGFSDLLERALAKAKGENPKRALALGIVGDKDTLRVTPTRDTGAVLAAVRASLEKPADGFRNVYEHVRRVASLLARRSGSRELFLVSLENGDGEDDLEATASALSRLHVHCSVLTTEAYLADSFYVSGSRAVPRGLTPGAGDAPYVTLPWGWLFQQAIANETTPSGFAHYGLTRLAAASGGKVFLYAAPAGTHRCAIYGSCPFCAEDHQPRDEAFRSHRLDPLAPPADSRHDAGARLAHDPWFRAVLSAWAAASKEGLVRSRPSVRIAGGGVKPERRQTRSWAPLFGSPSGFGRLASKADKLAKTCDRILAALETDMGRIAEGEGSPRYRAYADYTRAMLYLTRTNLVGYAAWCREIAPKLLGKEPYEFEPPEIQPLIEGRRVAGVSYTPLSLCHGVAPFGVLELPGGKAFRAELDQLDDVLTPYMRRYAHTPYGMALRHQGIARFYFTYRGTVTPTPRPKVGSTQEAETTEPGRPSRSGSPSSGGTSSGGATTGGG